MAEDAEAIPDDAEGWRARIVAVPARDLLRLLQKNAPRVLAGFRATSDALRNPVVLARIVEEAVKQPAFAKELAELPTLPAIAAPPAQKSAPPPAPAADTPAPGDARLREKIREQRAALRERDERLAGMESALADLRRERDAAVESAETARRETDAARTRTERAERLRRREERAERRADESLSETPRRARREENGGAPIPPAPSLWEETLRRLLRRGRHAVVAEVCRERLAAGTESGVVHALYAEALRAGGDEGAAADQERLAAAAYLDAGDVLAAAEAFVRALRGSGNSPEPREPREPRKNGADAVLLRRLLLLAGKAEKTETVRAVFGRLRGGDGAAFRRLSQMITALGGRFSRFAPHPTRLVVGPDETIALPAGLSAVTPRRLAHAVETGDGSAVARAREGIAALRASAPDLADALLQAVAEVWPPAVGPLTRPTRSVVVDASNVARHDPDPLAFANVPRVGHLRRMRDFLLDRGYFPVVLIADANLRFHADDRAAYLALVERGVVRETLPGTSADAALLREARERGAPLVTNDRMADWGDEAAGVERLPFGISSDGIFLMAY